MLTTHTAMREYSMHSFGRASSCDVEGGGAEVGEGDVVGDVAVVDDDNGHGGYSEQTAEDDHCSFLSSIGHRDMLTNLNKTSQC